MGRLLLARSLLLTSVTRVMAESGHDINAKSSSPGFKAVLIGASGATGKCLLTQLIKCKEFQEVTVLGRREVDFSDIKEVDVEREMQSFRVRQHVIDMENISMETCGAFVKDKDVFFTTLGTTRRQAGSAKAFEHVDFDYNFNSAKLAKEGGVKVFSLLSSSGAKASSWFLYLRVKGQLDEAVTQLHFPSLSVFRPGMLQRGPQQRFVEKVAGLVMSSISVNTVAKAMVADALNQLKSSRSSESKTSIYTNPEIESLAATLVTDALPGAGHSTGGAGTDQAR